MPTGKKFYKSCLILYIILLFISIPFTTSINTFLQKSLKGANYIIYFSLPCIFCAGVLAYLLIQNNKDRTKYIYLIIISSMYLFFLIKQKYPIERVHFTEYGILSYLAYRVVGEGDRNKFMGYVYALLIVLAIGIVDESIQYLLANRVGEIRDIGINMVSGGLALALYGLVIRQQA